MIGLSGSKWNFSNCQFEKQLKILEPNLAGVTAVASSKNVPNLVMFS